MATYEKVSFTKGWCGFFCGGLFGMGHSKSFKKMNINKER